MAVFASTYDISTPDGDTDTPAEADDRMREIKAAIQERENVDHFWPLDGTEVSDPAAGEHRKVTLRVGSAPTKADNKGILYAKDVSGKAELFYIDEDGNEVQITSGGAVVSADFPGKIVAYGGSSAPSGWVLCDGSAYSRTVTYDALFAIIGIAYGVGDESTTFNVPDYRGRTPIGLDAGNVNLDASDTLGETGGEENHTLTEAEMPSHGHQIKYEMSSNGLSEIDSSKVGCGNNLNSSNFSNTTSIQDAGSDNAHNNLQPYQTANFIIKI